MGRRDKDIDTYLRGRSGPRDKRKNSVKKVTRRPEPNRKPKFERIPKDLHGKGLHDAEEIIKKEIEKRISDNFCIEFCHGHNSGTQIRDFIREGRLDQYIISKNFKVDIWYKNEGNTFVETK